MHKSLPFVQNCQELGKSCEEAQNNLQEDPSAAPGIHHLQTFKNNAFLDLIL